MDIPAILAEHSAKLDAILSALAAKTEERPMTVKEFASRVGVNRKTIYHRLKEGALIKKMGRIPHSELAKFGIK